MMTKTSHYVSRYGGAGVVDGSVPCCCANQDRPRRMRGA